MSISRIMRMVAMTAGAALFVAVVAACGDEETAQSAANPVVTPPDALVLPPTSTPLPSPTATNTPSPTATASPSMPSAAEILRRAATAMESVQSGHIEMDTTATLEGDDDTSFEVRISGDFHLPDRSQATMSVKTQGFTVELEFISIGVESYIKNPLTGQWEANMDATDSFGDFLAAPAFNTDFPADSAAQFELVGVESLEGENVYHLRATMSGSELAELIEDQELSNAEGEVLYWIGVDDYLVRKVEVVAEQESDEGSVTTQTVIVLSDYNSDVDIVAPEVETPWWEGLEHTTEEYIQATVGEAIEGSIDVESQEVIYEFEAEDSADYRIDIMLGTLVAVDVIVYDDQGNDIGWGWVYEDGEVEPAVLEDAIAGTHYITVSHYEGTTGTYTLTITRLDDQSG